MGKRATNRLRKLSGSSMWARGGRQDPTTPGLAKSTPTRELPGVLAERLNLRTGNPSLSLADVEPLGLGESVLLQGSPSTTEPRTILLGELFNIIRPDPYRFRFGLKSAIQQQTNSRRMRADFP
jgi:hypothetical protein